MQGEIVIVDGQQENVLQHQPAPQPAHEAFGSLNAKLGEIPGFNLLGTKIHRVSKQTLEKLNNQLIPKTIGLGFFHMDLDSPYQALKLQMCKEYMTCSAYPLETLCEVVDLESYEIEHFYFPTPEITRAQMIEIMLTDALFVLELFGKYESFLISEGALQGIYKWIPNHVMKSIRKDLLMFENQIPFSVIARLYSKQNGKSDETTEKLIRTCMKFFGVEIPRGQNLALEPDHLLGLYCDLYAPRPKAHTEINVREKKQSAFIPKTVPTARGLKESGIEFGKSPAQDYVTFSKGKLELPFLEFDDFKRCVLANLVIFEGVRGGKKPVSSLCFFLNSLMRTEEDVNILSKRGIIENTSGNDKEIVDFFSHICMDVDISSKEYLSRVIVDVNRHFHSKPRRWCAAIKREHFKWPWSVAIFIWGLILAAASIAGFIFNLQRHINK